MPRQSISFTVPNADWLETQITSKEYRSKSDVINDLIRNARKEQENIAYIRTKLRDAEQSGFSDKFPDQILVDMKRKVRQNGEL